jgi:hypothetical protein
MEAWTRGHRILVVYKVWLGDVVQSVPTVRDDDANSALSAEKHPMTGDEPHNGLTVYFSNLIQFERLWFMWIT